MKTLPKGANAPLAPSGSLRVDLRWDQARGNLDVVCFGVGADGRVPADEWFLFYNQPQAPGGVMRITASEAGHTGFLVQLERIPAHIQKCLFAATLETGLFRDMAGATLTAIPPSGERIAYTLNDATDEQALIFAELYRHAGTWKLRAIGQGFRGGLQALAERFGLAVSQDASPPATPPRPAPTPPAGSEPDRDHARDRDDPRRSHPSFTPDAESDRPADGPPRPTPNPSPRSRRFPVKGLLVVLILLLAGGGGALWYLRPDLLPDLLADLRGGGGSRLSQETPAPAAPQRTAPAPYEPPSCSLPNDKVFERYHALGDSYVKIMQQVERGNQTLTQLRQDLIKFAGACPSSFLDDTRREIAQLEKLPVEAWMKEATSLNACAGLMIKKIETELNGEARPIIIQRLMRETDRARNLESDLTNMSRDLAYLNNKTKRLIEGYRENLEACAP